MSTTSLTTSVYRVDGMTCGHCANAVSHEVGAVSGVCGVSVDLSTGRVTVTSDRVLPHAEVAAAVDEAGYQLIS